MWSRNKQKYNLMEVSDLNTETIERYGNMSFVALSNVSGGRTVIDPSYGGKPVLKDPGKPWICNSIIGQWTGIIC